MPCYERHSSKDVGYLGKIPEWSKLYGVDGVSVEDALIDLLGTMVDIRNTVAINMANYGFVNYPEDTRLIHILQIHSELIAGNTVGPVVFNDEQKKSGVRNNCGVGKTGGQMEYVIQPMVSASIISKAKANSRVIAFLNNNIQRLANLIGSCDAPTIYRNAKLILPFTRDNCEHFTPSPVYYTVAEGTYFSIISQSDADRKAFEDAEKNGQRWANVNSACPTFFESSMRTGYFRKKCGDGMLSEEAFYSIPQGYVVSRISQCDADARARIAFEELGQANADATMECKQVFYSEDLCAYYAYGFCPSGYRGYEREVCIEAEASFSFESQEAANALAMELLNVKGRSQVNSEQKCVENNHLLTITLNNDSLAEVYGAGVYPDGTVVTVTVVPIPGYGISKVLVDGERFATTGNSFDILMNKRTFVKVYITGSDSIIITPESSDSIMGTVAGGGEKTVGAKCNILAEPNRGYSFVHWLKDGEIVSESKLYSFITDINSGGVYTAIFE